MERLIAAVTLCIAFVVMASIFAPDRSKAGEAGAASDPHAQLRLLGTLESHGLVVRMYATSAGPRYSVWDSTGSKSMATLLSREEMSREFPDVPVDNMHAGAETLLGETGDGRE
jgi:hypothetical protein